MSVVPPRLDVERLLPSTESTQSEHMAWTMKWEDIMKNHENVSPHEKTTVLIISWENCDLDKHDKLKEEVSIRKSPKITTLLEFPYR